MFSSSKNTNRYETISGSVFGSQFHELSAISDDGDPPEGGLIIHTVPESNRSPWHHIKDLDSFFSRVYTYHQKNGFKVMMIQEVLELVQFIFVVGFCTFLFHGVDYGILFKDKLVNSSLPLRKVTLNDAIYPIDQFWSHFNTLTWLLLIIALIFWMIRLVKVVCHFFHFWDIHMFYKEALKIDENSLSDMTWYDVQNKLKEVQKELMMCIHKHDLTDLDIYHRILRFRNYLVAMVNKNVLPLKIKIPFVGEVPIVTQSLLYNLEFILFWGPYSPFENNWHLREDFQVNSKRHELANKLSTQIVWVAILNFCLSNLITLWQLLYFLFNYADVIKREPGFFGSRRWSLYSRLYLRHFNELDHELDVRLNQAYRPATKYFNIFTSPLLITLAKNICFFFGSILIVLLMLTVYDEDFLAVEHVLSIITIFGVIVAMGRSMIPDDNIVWCPESLMRQILAHVHYLSASWRGLAHTVKVRQEFGHLFQYRAVFSRMVAKFSYFIMESLSGFTTPLMLLFYIRPKALEIVDFFRENTTSIVGVGDVCSFAQMDIKKHGDIYWQNEEEVENPQQSQGEGPDQDAKTNNGKTELSLIHFISTNPKWDAPLQSKAFINKLKQNVQLMTNKMATASIACSNYSSIYENDIYLNKMDDNLTSHVYQPFTFNEESTIDEEGKSSMILKGAINKSRGPLIKKNIGISLGASLFGANSETFFDQSINMNISTLFLHDQHQKRIKRDFVESTSSRPSTSATKKATNLTEKTPLLGTTHTLDA